MYTTYSTSFETPTTTEFNKPDGTGGFNESLEPQVAHNIEVGLRGALGERQRYEIAVFTIDVEDELIPFEVPTSPGRNYYQNAGKSQHDGIEFSWTVNPTDRLQTTVSYAYSDFTFNNGLVIPGTAENTLFAGLSYTHPRGWFVAGDALFIDEQFGDNQNSAAGLVDSYTVANLRAGYQASIGKMALSPFVGVNNLFDEDYTANVRLNPVGVGTAAGRYFEQAPTRNAYAGVSLNWKFGN
jgi:iron complex outermembrane recepter protein